jgi:VIT1/CCC1 family predicted Fe2+/Mn2+ transporter
LRVWFKGCILGKTIEEDFMPTPRLEHSHRPDDIAKRLASGPNASYLRDWVYGGIDGTVTTFAIVAGSIGADLSATIILILGAANLFADGFSMAAANYSGSKSEIEDYARLKAVEEKHIAVAPDGEREEIRQIFRAKGYDGSDLDTLVELVSSNKSIWIETMMQAEYGLTDSARSPLKAALYTFAAFVLFGSIPLMPFVFPVPASAATATVLTILAFFTIGSLRARWSQRHWVSCGLETTAIGTFAAAIAFGVGYGLQALLG